MRPRIIIIPGLEKPRWPRPFSYLLDLYIGFFELDAGKRSWMRFAEYLRSHGFDVLVVEPVYWFSRSAIVAAANELARAIDQQNGRSILFGYSLGTSVIEAALPKCRGTANIVKILSVAAPHANNVFAAPAAVSVVNIYSDSDRYLSFSNRMLYGSNIKRLDNAENIQLNGLKHAAFCAPALYDFYLQLLQ